MTVAPSGPSSTRPQPEAPRLHALQDSLRVLAGVLALALLFGAGGLLAARVLGGGSQARDALAQLLGTPATCGLAPFGLVCLSVWILLGRRRLAPGPLRWLDSCLSLAAQALTLTPYTLDYDVSSPGHAAGLAVLVLLLLGRAMLVPSGALRTLLVSAPAVIAVPLVQLYHGHTYPHPGRGFPDRYFQELFVLDLVVLTATLALATWASARARARANPD